MPRRDRIDGLLRGVLAPLMALAPDALRFSRESKGRPLLAHPGAPDFNLSDTTGGTLIAIAASGRVGVDLEKLDRQLPLRRLAKRWFSAVEADALDALPEEVARAAFLRLWTAKEASCKATGTGIYGYLSQWVFEVAPDQPTLRHLPDDAGLAQDWRFLRLQPTPDHTAVLALRDIPVGPLRCYSLAAE